METVEEMKTHPGVRAAQGATNHRLGVAAIVGTAGIVTAAAGGVPAFTGLLLFCAGFATAWWGSRWWLGQIDTRLQSMRVGWSKEQVAQATDAARAQSYEVGFAAGDAEGFQRGSPTRRAEDFEAGRVEGRAEGLNTGRAERQAADYDAGLQVGVDRTLAARRQIDCEAAHPTDLRALVDYVALDTDGEIFVRVVIHNAGRATWRINRLWLASLWSDAPRVALRGGGRAHMAARELNGAPSDIPPMQIVRFTFRGKLTGAAKLERGMFLHGWCGVGGAAPAPAGGIALQKINPHGEAAPVVEVSLDALNGGAPFHWWAQVTDQEAKRVVP